MERPVAGLARPRAVGCLLADGALELSASFVAVAAAVDRRRHDRRRRALVVVLVIRVAHVLKARVVVHVDLDVARTLNERAGVFGLGLARKRCVPSDAAARCHDPEDLLPNANEAAPHVLSPNILEIPRANRYSAISNWINKEVPQYTTVFDWRNIKRAKRIFPLSWLRRAPSIMRTQSYRRPAERLEEAETECMDLDRELKVLENSGHVRLGVFAKPFVNLQRREQPDTTEPLFYHEECADPFYHQFYDDRGRSLFEQLLRGRMRVLALAKMTEGRSSVTYVRAEVELAEAYARINLWKQGHVHALNANELLKAIDPKKNGEPYDASLDGSASQLLRFLEFCYDKQQDPSARGQVALDDLIVAVASWNGLESDESSPRGKIESPVIPLFEETSLRSLFGTKPSLHWQQLITRLEIQDKRFQKLIADLEAAVFDANRRLLLGIFNSLDPSHERVIPVHALLMRLQDLETRDSYIQAMEIALQDQLESIGFPSITWAEVLSQGHNQQLQRQQQIRELWPRIKLFMGRLFLRKGQLDDAVRQLEIAIAEQEQLLGTESESLVQFYLVIAEALTVRFKQMTIVSQQNALESAEKWLQSVEGGRSLRSKAIQLIDEECESSGTVMARKEAESRARDILLQEYAAISCVKPDPAMIDDAVEFCSKAWSLQESFCGHEHITTAIVHVTLARIYLSKAELEESTRYFLKAIEIYESSCNGPVPASGFLRLELAKVYLQQHDVKKAQEVYMQVGDFFHSFAREFADSDATRRECCAHAIDSYRQWLAHGSRSTLANKQRILKKIHDATVDGYGEFTLEASEGAKELGHLLSEMGQLKSAEKYLKTACYILESHFGSNDRRYRLLKKEVLEINSQAKMAALHPEQGGADDEGHAWLVI